MAGYFGDAQQVHISPPSSFQTAIRYTSNKSIHEGNARAIVIGTDIYYSPNCSRTPLLPSKCPQKVRNPLKDDIEEYHNPQWWNTDTGYLPFLPTNPQFGSPPFHQLYNNLVSTGPRKTRRLRMESNDVLNWKRLESSLTHIFRSFQSTYSIPDMTLIVSTSLACQDAFEYPSQFHTAEKRCRKWFAMWMAMVSLGIAVAQVYDDDSEDTLVPKWYTTFVQHTDEVLLAGVRQQLGRFNPWFPRAGVFIDLCSSIEQPTIDFLVRLNIPVWYPWGTAEELQVRRNPSYWAKYTPPPHMLQHARSFLNSVPGPIPSKSLDEEEDNQPWRAFIANRARRAIGPVATKKPPMKVFHWERDDGGKWQRTSVLKQLRQETLDDYGKNQKVFDEQSNEWDCCTNMGDLDAEERQALFDEEDEVINPIHQERLLAVPDGRVSSPVTGNMSTLAAAPFNEDEAMSSEYPSSSNITVANEHSKTDLIDTSTEANSSYLPDQRSPADLLSLYFGYVPPPPFIRLDLAKALEQQIKDLTLGIGCSNVDLMYKYVETVPGRYAAQFFWSMSQSPWIPPSNVLFDLARGNPRSIMNRRRLKFMHQLPGDTFLFDFQNEATVEWHICVTDVNLAMMIVRLDEELSDYDIARTLLNQGSTFWTVLEFAPFAIKQSPAGISRIRLSSYQFSAEDYTSYRYDCANILRSPRVARQALMRGGILWRLVIEHASFQDVLAGPTTVATIHHHCKSISGGGNRIYVDDVLTDHEIEMICGVYYVYTGKLSNKRYITMVNSPFISRSRCTNGQKIVVAYP